MQIDVAKVLGRSHDKKQYKPHSEGLTGRYVWRNNNTFVTYTFKESVAPSRDNENY